VKLAGAFLALIPLAFGGMDRVWELRLSDYIHESNPNEVGEAHDVVAAAFSPDGRFLGVTTYRGRGPHTHLMIFDVGSPSSHPRQIDLETCPQDIQWSPSGVALKICDIVLRVADGSTCHEDRSAEFVDEQHMGHFAQPNFVLDDIDCKMTASWGLDGDLVVDSAPARKLALFRSAGQLKILDVETREVLQGWSHKPGALMHVAFAEAG
jgi:dipeptidyl aminopeptidase/acylaminoacyl peptidase